MTNEAPYSLATADHLAGQRLEDLEEALRRMVIVLQPDGRRSVTERELAALALACDVLDLDFPELDWLADLT